MTPSPEQRPSSRPDDDGGKGRKSGEWGETALLLAKVSGIGWFIVGSIGLATLGGYWLDGRFDTSPILTLVGLALGIVVAFRGMIGIVRSIARTGNKKQ